MIIYFVTVAKFAVLTGVCAKISGEFVDVLLVSHARFGDQQRI
jgi:hypothetical protein